MEKRDRLEPCEWAFVAMSAMLTLISLFGIAFESAFFGVVR